MDGHLTLEFRIRSASTGAGLDDMVLLGEMQGNKYEDED
jgi:hypothetical protein